MREKFHLVGVERKLKNEEQEIVSHGSFLILLIVTS